MKRSAGSSYTLRGLRINNAALAAPELPRRIKLLEWGTNESTKGPVTVNARTAESLPLNQRAKGFESIAIDFDHNSLPGSDTYEKGRAIEIAGYGIPRVVENDGLWLDEIQWTPAGERYARNYKDLSPAPGMNDSDEVVFLHSAALTPNGSVYDLEFFSSHTSSNKHTAPMTDKVLSILTLTSLLGLPETATEADLQAKLTPAQPPDIKPLEKELAALTARVDGLSATGSSGSTVVDLDAKIASLNAKIDGIICSRASESTSREQFERDQLIAEACRVGKVIPLSTDTLKLVPLAALREMVDKLPKNMVPLHARGNAAGDTSTGNICSFSASVSAKLKAGKSKGQAIIESVRENPEAYAEYRELGAPAL